MVVLTGGWEEAGNLISTARGRRNGRLHLIAVRSQSRRLFYVLPTPLLRPFLLYLPSLLIFSPSCIILPPLAFLSAASYVCHRCLSSSTLNFTARPSSTTQPSHQQRVFLRHSKEIFDPGPRLDAPRKPDHTAPGREAVTVEDITYTEYPTYTFPILVEFEAPSPDGTKKTSSPLSPSSCASRREALPILRKNWRGWLEKNIMRRPRSESGVRMGVTASGTIPVRC